MFTNKEIQLNLNKILATPKVEIVHIQKEQYDFKSVSSEQNIDIIISQRSKYVDLLTFWIKSIPFICFELESEFDYNEYFYGNCVEVSPSNFNKEFKSWNQGLIKPIYLEYDFKEYYQIKNDWNDQAFILVANDKILCLIWNTSA
jgi:hypothetical protein